MVLSQSLGYLWLNTTRKLVSVKRDRLSLCFKTTTVFVFFFRLSYSRLCSAWSILIFSEQISAVWPL